MTRVMAVLLALAAPVAALDDCPAPAAGDVGFSITLNSAAVASNQSSAQHILTTHGADTDMQLLVDELDDVSGSTPEKWIKFTTTDGTPLNFCRSQLVTGGSSKITGGFIADATAAEGLRICAYVDADESNSADQHAPATACASGTGGFGIWTMAYLAPSTSNLANPGTYDLGATFGQDTPASGTDGPFGVSWTTSRSGNMAYWDMAGSNAVSVSKTFTVMAGFGPDDAANSTPRQIVVDREGTTRWQMPVSLWWRDGTWPKSMAQPLQGAGFGPVGFKSDNTAEDQWMWCTSSVAANNRSCYELGGSGAVATGTQPDGTTTTATDYFAWGGQSGTKNHGLNGSIWSFRYKEDFVIAEDAARMLEAEVNDPDTAWTVELIAPAPSVLRPTGTMRLYRLYASIFQDAAAATCASGDVQVGDACDPFGAALDLLLGDTDR